MKRIYLFLPIVVVLILPMLLPDRYQTEEITVPTSLPSENQLQNSVIIRVLDHEVMEMDLETYVLCVLLGEMPADFEEEALKAQAVAIRTYTLSKVLNQDKHTNTDVCTDSSCCQAFVYEDDYRKESDNGAENYARMRNAVTATKGEVLTYNDQIIEATYFSCSGGKTEDAAEVWGTNVPYLKSVISPGEENARHYQDEFRYTYDVFRDSLNLPENFPLNADAVRLSYTDGGGVRKMKIADYEFSGTQLRMLLALPSTVMTISFTDKQVIITTNGFGHRVGMSQYGADAMAVTGKHYDEILTHYYPGTELVYFDSAQMQALFDKV